MFFAPSKSRYRAKIWIIDVPKTRDHTKIKIMMPNPSQEPPASSKAPNQDFQDMDVLCTFEIHIENQNLDQGCNKDQWPNSNQDQDAKPQSGISSVLQSSKLGLKGHGCPLPLQNQDREQRFGSYIYQRPGTISKSRSWCQTPVMNLEPHPKSQIRTQRTWMFFEPLKSR